MPDTTPILIDDGQVKVGDIVLPGIYQDLEIRKAVALDEQSVPGRSGSSKQPLGFEDGEVTLLLLLVDDDDGDRANKLRAIVDVFQAQDSQARPLVYSVASPMLEAWRISQVVFRELRSHESSEWDGLEAECVFVEHRPVTQKKERAAQAVEAQLVGATYVDEFGEGTTVMGEVDDYLAPYAAEQQDLLQSVEGGWLSGLTRQDKTDAAASLSPAVDDDMPRWGGVV